MAAQKIAIHLERNFWTNSSEKDGEPFAKHSQKPVI